MSEINPQSTYGVSDEDRPRSEIPSFDNEKSPLHGKELINFLNEADLEGTNPSSQMMSHEMKPPREESLMAEIEDSRPVEMKDVYGGRVFLHKRFTGDKPHFYMIDAINKSEQIQQLMRRIGFAYVYDENGKVADVLLPDPERLMRASEINNVPIVLEDDSNSAGRINQTEYAKVVLRDGMHPVGINGLSYYEHDITIDHMPAVIVLGYELFSIFKQGRNFMKGPANAYDIFTSNLTNAIEAIFDGDTEEYEKLITQVCPGIINGYVNGEPIDNGVAQQLDKAIMEGLRRLDIKL